MVMRRSSFSGREWDERSLDRTVWQARRSLPVADFALYQNMLLSGSVIPKERCLAIANNLLLIACHSRDCEVLRSLAADMLEYAVSDDRRQYKVSYA